MQPNLHPTQLQLIQWSSKCSVAIGKYFDLCKPFLLEEPQINTEFQFVLSQLAISCHLTSESVFLLISNVKLWDSDILIRAVTEGTYKYLFLCVGDVEEQAVRLREYWNDLPEMNRIKRHSRVQDFLAKIENPDTDEWKPMRDLLLNPNELNDLQDRYPRKSRQEIEQKWSFNGIAQSLSKSKTGSDEFGLMKHMNFSYGMASHLVHQDAVAISIIWDRNQRNPERYESIQLAHGARGLSDLVSMAMTRAVATFRVHEKDIKPVRDLHESHKDFLEEMNTAYKLWWEIEYEKYADPAEFEE